MIKLIHIFICSGFIAFLTASCTKEYFEDTGVHDDTFEGTTWEYLNSKPEHFSLLIDMINAADMKEVFDSEGQITFFAPKNPSIEKSIYRLNRSLESQGKDTVSNYEQIKPEVWEEFLGLYIVPGAYELKDITQVDTITYAYKGQTYKSLNGRSMNIGLMYHSAGGVQYAGYRQIIYAYIDDFALPESSRVNTVVATANNRTKNGIVHVLQAYEHIFPFTSANFQERVHTGGFISTP